MRDDIPPTFDARFLRWLLDGRPPWAPPPTKSPLAPAEIDAVERREGARLPPDFRLFLETVPPECPIGDVAFPDWREDGVVSRGVERIRHGLVFDVEHNQLWAPEWGPRPDDASMRAEIVRQAIDAAPKVAPVYGHRFLVVEPCVAGNPVLSVMQSDVIVYGSDLRRYLLNECGLIERRDAVDDRLYREEHVRIPFWGALLERTWWPAT
jgi:hypothetical protein